ncbi:DUF6950 family protein [Rhodovulum viride]|uniref:DUF6950 family protein n=1 Tax=Rhodovulum viride TaxID=1231134 RepID=UPI003CCC74B5
MPWCRRKRTSSGRTKRRSPVPGGTWRDPGADGRLGIDIFRHPDWQRRLIGYLESRASTPFEYGIHDCAAFAHGAAEAMTGTALAPDRFGYRTHSGGLRVARRAGLADAAGWLDAHLPSCPHSMARQGDLVLVAGDEGPTLSVCQGPYVYVPMAIEWGTLPLTTGLRAWRIG